MSYNGYNSDFHNAELYSTSNHEIYGHSSNTPFMEQSGEKTLPCDHFPNPNETFHVANSINAQPPQSVGFHPNQKCYSVQGDSDLEYYKNYGYRTWRPNGPHQESNDLPKGRNSLFLQRHNFFVPINSNQHHLAKPYCSVSHSLNTLSGVIKEDYNIGNTQHLESPCSANVGQQAQIGYINRRLIQTNSGRGRNKGQNCEKPQSTFAESAPRSYGNSRKLHNGEFYPVENNIQNWSREEEKKQNHFRQNGCYIAPPYDASGCAGENYYGHVESHAHWRPMGFDGKFHAPPTPPNSAGSVEEKPSTHTESFPATTKNHHNTQRGLHLQYSASPPFDSYYIRGNMNTAIYPPFQGNHHKLCDVIKRASNFTVPENRLPPDSLAFKRDIRHVPVALQENRRPGCHIDEYSMTQPPFGVYSARVANIETGFPVEQGGNVQINDNIPTALYLPDTSLPPPAPQPMTIKQEKQLDEVEDPLNYFLANEQSRTTSIKIKREKSPIMLTPSPNDLETRRTSLFKSPHSRPLKQICRSSSPGTMGHRSKSPSREHRVSIRSSRFNSPQPVSRPRRSSSPFTKKNQSRSPSPEYRGSRRPSRVKSPQPVSRPRRSLSPVTRRTRSRSPSSKYRRSRRPSSFKSPLRRTHRSSPPNTVRSPSPKGRGPSRFRSARPSPVKYTRRSSSSDTVRSTSPKGSRSAKRPSRFKSPQPASEKRRRRSSSLDTTRSLSRSTRWSMRRSPSSFSSRSSKARSRSKSRATKRSGCSPSPPRSKSTAKVTSRDELVDKWRRLNCDTDKEFENRMEQIADMNSDAILREESSYYTRSAAIHPYYQRDNEVVDFVKATPVLNTLTEQFHDLVIKKPQAIRAEGDHLIPPAIKRQFHKCKHHGSCSSSSEDDEEDDWKEMAIMEELERKLRHPFRLHRELWHNEPGEMNDGPLCKCSIKAKRSGIRHGLYAGESDEKFKCNVDTNGAGKLYHYRITISPPTNFLSRTPTIINYDGHEYLFEGFSLFSHYKLPELPVCKVIRFNIEYMILYIEEPYLVNFTIRECDLFFEYLFREILELLDLDLYASDINQCPVYHFMPRFVRELPEKVREILPMSVVLKYLMTSYKPLMPEELLSDIKGTSESRWREFTDEVKGMLVTKPGVKPSSIRVDQLDKHVDEFKNEENSEHLEATTESNNSDQYPIIIHFGIRPPQLSYAGNQEYQKAWRDYVKHRHLIANLAKPSIDEKRKLLEKEEALQRMRSKGSMKRDVTVILSSKGFYRTGLMCDVVQHAMLIPVLACHLRFHRSLNVLETTLGYKFKNRHLLQLALTHPSYRENFGTNPDHARNSLTNCGIRQPQYGDRRIHFMSTKKSGINTLIKIMSRFGSMRERESSISHNERLEFLGDAVVEFVSTIHLFFIFRDLEEGGLATYRAALVQNQHLALLAQQLNLDAFLLYAHGSDLCHDLELKHALANCFEAVMGALFLDGGINVPDRVFGMALYGTSREIHNVWKNYPDHPLQEQEPYGDRIWIEKLDYLKQLAEFEKLSGAHFKHIRLLARAFTDRSVGYTNLTLGSNQRLEFLGDSVLQLVASEYLYKHFPDHHEGHLSLLRSSLVNNKTQSVVCDDLGLTQYACYAAVKTELKVKDKADLLEAFIGALYVDTRDLDYIRGVCDVCFFPRLRFFIMNQEWNDPKSKLQQCCLTLRSMDGGEPDIPRYKVVECKGPTNARSYSIAVYFRGERLGKASGRSIQEAEMSAASEAMERSGNLFPQLDHQRRVVAKITKRQPRRRMKRNEPQIKSKRSPSRLNERS